MNGFAVATIFTAVDKFSPILNKAQVNVNKFSVGTKAALRAIVPETSKVSRAFKSMAGQITIGTLAAKGIVGAARLIRDNFGNAVNYASDLIEVQNVVNTVFGGASSTIDKFATTTAKKFGLTELQAKNFTSTFGAMFSSMGIKGDPLIKMSTDLAGRVGDFASMYNLNRDDAMNKFRSAMAGQTEPLLRFGINMNAASMEEFTKTKGIKTAWKDMDELNKTMLRCQFIMERTSLVAGDYGKPIASWAVSSQDAAAAVQEMTGKLAQVLMPVLIKGADTVTKIARRVTTWAEANRLVLATKIEAFITKTFERAKTLYKIIKDFGPIILIAVAAVKAFQATKTAYVAYKTAVAAFNLMLGAQAVATTAATGAQVGLNVAMAANPIGLIIAGIVALIGLFVLLATKVGGLGNAFKVVGQTIMKLVLTPLNFVVDAVQGLLTGIGKIPGMEWAENASAAIAKYQDKANTILTGSSSTMLESGAKGAIAGYRSGGVGGAIAGAASGSLGVLNDPYQTTVAANRNAELNTRAAAGRNAAMERRAQHSKALEAARESAAVSGTGGEKNEMAETNALIEQLVGKADDQIDATKGLGKGSATSPAKLRWGAMGSEDYFEIARVGL